MRFDCWILSVTRDGENWITIGRSRAEAEELHRRVLAEGKYPAPVYRVIAKRKPIEVSAA